MAEQSLLWTTNAAGSGDQQASYSQADFADVQRILAACAGFEGVAPGYLNELECTDGGAETVAVDTGGAVVDGIAYKNDASQNVTVAAAVGAGNTRIDRIVVRASWAGFNASVTLIAGTDAASPTAPAITQTSETTYDIQLCQVLVDTSGNVTVTDERTWAAVNANGIDADAVNGSKIADDSIDSEHYVDGSIDTAHIGDDQVTDTKLRNSAAYSIIGRAVGTSGDSGDIVAGDDTVLKRTGTGFLGFGTLVSNHIGNDQIDSQHYVDGSIDTAHIGDDQVTPAKTSFLSGMSSTAKIYAGDGGGVAGTGDLPSGWTYARNGVGDYRVTHSLGTTDYAVVLTRTAASGYNVGLRAQPLQANYFEVEIFAQDDGANEDGLFMFVLVVY